MSCNQSSSQKENIDYAGKWLKEKYYLMFTSKNTMINYNSLMTSNTKFLTNSGFRSNSRSSFSLPFPAFTDETQLEYSEADPTISELTLSTYFGYQLKKGLGSFASNQFIQAATTKGNIALVDSIVNKYSGSAPRTFSFSWEFTPLSAAETLDILKIIFVLKLNSLPSTKSVSKADWDTVSSGISLDTVDTAILAYLNKDRKTIESVINKLENSFEKVCMPDIFYIKPSRDLDDTEDPYKFWLYAIKPCYVTDVSVSIGDSDIVDFYGDGMPIKINLSVSFTEITEQRRENYSPLIKLMNK